MTSSSLTDSMTVRQTLQSHIFLPLWDAHCRLYMYVSFLGGSAGGVISNLSKTLLGLELTPKATSQPPAPSGACRGRRGARPCAAGTPGGARGRAGARSRQAAAAAGGGRWEQPPAPALSRACGAAAARSAVPSAPPARGGRPLPFAFISLRRVKIKRNLPAPAPSRRQ